MGLDSDHIIRATTIRECYAEFRVTLPYGRGSAHVKHVVVLLPFCNFFGYNVCF